MSSTETQPTTAPSQELQEPRQDEPQSTVTTEDKSPAETTQESTREQESQPSGEETPSQEEKETTSPTSPKQQENEDEMPSGKGNLPDQEVSSSPSPEVQGKEIGQPESQPKDSETEEGGKQQEEEVTHAISPEEAPTSPAAQSTQEITEQQESQPSGEGTPLQEEQMAANSEVREEQDDSSPPQEETTSPASPSVASQLGSPNQAHLSEGGGTFSRTESVYSKPKSRPQRKISFSALVLPAGDPQDISSHYSSEDPLSTFPVNTPRSLKTCKLMGIEPEELLFKPLTEFLYPDPEERQVAFKYHEEARQTLLKQAQEMYAAVCEREEKRSTTDFSPNDTGIQSKSPTHSLTEQLENLWVKKLEDQQKRDVAHIIAQEVKRQQQEKAIREELERREKEKRLRDEKLQERRRKKKEQHIQKVKERVSKVRKSLNDRQKNQLAKMRDQELKQEMKRIEFERKQEELQAKNRERASEKAKAIQATLAKRRQKELETLIKNQEKQQLAEERLASLKLDWEERMEQNRRDKEEREQKRKNIIDLHEKKVEEKQRQLIIQQKEKLEKYDALIQKRDADLKKRKLEHKMMEKQKQNMVERHQRAKEAELREKLKLLEEKHNRLEEQKRQKQLLVEKCKQIQYERQSNRERMRDYLYLMRQTNRIEPPDFVDHNDIKDYLEKNGLHDVQLDKRKLPAPINDSVYNHLLGKDKLLFSIEKKKKRRKRKQSNSEDKEENGSTEKSVDAQVDEATAEHSAAVDESTATTTKAQQSKTPSPSKRRKRKNPKEKLSKSVELVRMDTQFLDRSRFFLTNPTPSVSIHDPSGGTIRATVKKTTQKKKALPPISPYQKSREQLYTTPKGLPVSPVDAFAASQEVKKKKRRRKREKLVDIDWSENDLNVTSGAVRRNSKKKQTA